MWKVLSGVGVAAILLYGLSQLDSAKAPADQADQDAVELLSQAEPRFAGEIGDPAAPRAGYGNLLTTVKDESYVTGWDRTAAEAWLVNQRDEMRAKIVDPEILTIAEDTSFWNDGADGFIFERTDKAVDLFYSGNPEDEDKSLYLLLVSAAEGDPRAIFGVSDHLTYLENPTPAERDMAGQLERLAADKGYLPSIVNYVFRTRKDEAVPAETVEAYISFGLQLDSTAGAANLALQAVEYYVFNRVTREDNGNASLALNQLKTFGWTRDYHIYRAEMAYRGKHMPQNFAVALESYEWLAKDGDSFSAMRAGYIQQVGETGTKDFEKAIAYYLVAAEGDNFTAFRNLGIMAEYGDGMPRNRSLAAALHARSMKLAEEKNAQSALSDARRSQIDILRDMTDSEKLAIAPYREMIEAGRVSEIEAFGPVFDIFAGE